MVVISASLNDSSFGRPSYSDCAGSVMVMTTRPKGTVKNASDTHTHIKQSVLQSIILSPCSAHWTLKSATCVPMILLPSRESEGNGNWLIMGQCILLCFTGMEGWAGIIRCCANTRPPSGVMCILKAIIRPVQA